MHGTFQPGQIPMIASDTNLLAKGADDARVRLPFVALATLVLWFAMLTIFGLLLNWTPAVPPVPAPVEISLMDISGLAGGGGGSSTGTSQSSSRPAAAMNPKKAAARSAAARVQPRAGHSVRPHQREAAKISTPMHHIAEAHDPSLPRKVLTPAKAEPNSANFSAPIKGGGASGGTGGGYRSGSGAGSGAGVAGSGNGTEGGFGNGGSGPRAIYAPVPNIPDDMRDEVMRATAVVRFHVRRDGEAHATLITSTDYSELDDLILATLQQWRFSPAVRDGVKVDADAEVRLLITVQ